MWQALRGGYGAHRNRPTTQAIGKRRVWTVSSEIYGRMITEFSGHATSTSWCHMPHNTNEYSPAA